MLNVSRAADCCVGYFHLRGWRKVADLVDRFHGGDGQQARVLVGMMRTAEQELLDDLSVVQQKEADAGEMRRHQTRLVEAFKQQLTVGMPDGATISGLRVLARQLRQGKVRVKLYLRYPLHAKLYLTYSDHPGAPIVSFLGSSNLNPSCYLRADAVSEQSQKDLEFKPPRGHRMDVTREFGLD